MTILTDTKAVAAQLEQCHQAVKRSHKRLAALKPSPKQIEYKAEFISTETELSYQDGRCIETPKHQMVLDYLFPETLSLTEIQHRIGKTIIRYSMEFRLTDIWQVETDCPF